MILLGIIAIIFFGVGIVMREGNMTPGATALGTFLYNVSIAIFVFLIIVSIVIGIAP